MHRSGSIDPDPLNCFLGRTVYGTLRGPDGGSRDPGNSPGSKETVLTAYSNRGDVRGP